MGRYSKVNIRVSNRFKQYGDEIHDLGMDINHLKSEFRYKIDKNTIDIVSNYLGKASKMMFDLSDRAKNKEDIIK